MKKSFFAALAAPALLAGLSLGTPAFAENGYSGDAEAQVAQSRQQHAERYGYRVLPPQIYREVPAWDRDRPYWNGNARQAAPRGYRWQRYGDRYALVRRSDGRVVQWHR